MSLTGVSARGLRRGRLVDAEWFDGRAVTAVVAFALKEELVFAVARSHFQIAALRAAAL